AMARWLESRQLARKPRLAERLQVERGWEDAVEAVLGDYLQALVIDNLDAASQWLDSLQEGSLVLWSDSAVDASNTALAPDSLLQRV
ncbi:hypothetical protein, partial [Gilvimarinus sp. 1_MG-2023]